MHLIGSFFSKHAKTKISHTAGIRLASHTRPVALKQTAKNLYQSIAFFLNACMTKILDAGMQFINGRPSLYLPCKSRISTGDH